jgi:hypothetical protein
MHADNSSSGQQLRQLFLLPVMLPPPLTPVADPEVEPTMPFPPEFRAGGGLQGALVPEHPGAHQRRRHDASAALNRFAPQTVRDSIDINLGYSCDVQTLKLRAVRAILWPTSPVI